MTKQQKIEIIGNSKEVMDGVKMLISLMKEAEIENFISIDYEVLSEKYELKLTRIKQS